jgi:hypothetical protein
MKGCGFRHLRALGDLGELISYRVRVLGQQKRVEDSRQNIPLE